MKSKAVLTTNKRKLLKHSSDTNYILYSHCKDSDINFLFLINNTNGYFHFAFFSLYKHNLQIYFAFCQKYFNYILFFLLFEEIIERL